jgi:hypothetical protein
MVNSRVPPSSCRKLPSTLLNARRVVCPAIWRVTPPNTRARDLISRRWIALPASDRHAVVCYCITQESLLFGIGSGVFGMDGPCRTSVFLHFGQVANKRGHKGSMLDLHQSGPGPKQPVSALQSKSVPA